MIDMTTLPPFPGGNPFLHDHYHMGIRLGTNVVIMHPNHQDKECPYFIICNTESGERTKVELKNSDKEWAIAELINNKGDQP